MGMNRQQFAKEIFLGERLDLMAPEVAKIDINLLLSGSYLNERGLEMIERRINFLEVMAFQTVGSA